MAPSEQDLLTDLRIMVARLDERTRNIDRKLDEAVVSRADLEERLGPLTANMNRWKGALVVITFIAGSVGATISTWLKHAIGGAS